MSFGGLATSATATSRRFFDSNFRPASEMEAIGPDSHSRKEKESAYGDQAIDDVAAGQYRENKPRALMFINRMPVEIIPGEENLLEVMEREGIACPKFCYHQQLSVAGNCRMCMVQLDGTQNILVACATAVMPGMSIITDSRLVRDAREGNIDMMLINHPNDCPICEQASNCELQHMCQGYGSASGDSHRDDKHTVNDFYFGPDIRICLTRCIHCTRCVRFTNEHAQDFTLGMVGRGGLSEISTFMDELEVTTENTEGAAYLCPVGNLNQSAALCEAMEKEEKEAAKLEPLWAQ